MGSDLRLTLARDNVRTYLPYHYTKIGNREKKAPCRNGALNTYFIEYIFRSYDYIGQNDQGKHNTNQYHDRLAKVSSHYLVLYVHRNPPFPFGNAHILKTKRIDKY